MEDIDYELDKLMNEFGKYYIAYGYPYNAEEENSRYRLREARIKKFKEWLLKKYKKLK